jgi:hypothetical protein
MTILRLKTPFLLRYKFGLAALLMTFTLRPAVAQPKPLDFRFRVGALLFEDDFGHGLSQWTNELENGGSVLAKNGALEVDVPAGATIWFKPQIEGPVLIEYEATALKQGGPNDRVSDLNCFWMARDARSPNDIFATKRSGKFADYNQLLTYYVGLGGNANTTTRFRRYIGEAELRPLLPAHDLGAPVHLLVPNQSQIIRLVAANGLIQFYRDERRVFELQDAQPYRSGWFGFRTVQSHLKFRYFRVYRLILTPAATQ